MLTLLSKHIDDSTSRSLEGSVSLMPVSDLIQWIEGSKKSGTLIVTHEDCTRRFFFQEGKLIFVWCDHDEQQLFDSIAEQFGLSLQTIAESLKNSDRLGISFMGLLSSEQGIPLERLGSLITGFAERALTSVLTWHTGRFRFHDLLPASVLCSPVTITPSQVLLDSTVQIDEARHAVKTDTDPVLNEIYELIRRGAIDIPPLPVEMQMLMERINDPNLTVDQIVEQLTDPLLVSKILRVCNSPFFGRREKVATVRDAVVYMGLKSLMSIVTVNTLSGFSPPHAEEIEQILHHCLMVGMIAKQLARDMGSNHEQAFICGLLHDLGRIVMLEMLSEYDLDHEKQHDLIDRHHQAVGALVAKKWNFSEEMQETIRYHHEPDQARQFPHLVQVIHVSNLLATNQSIPLDSDSGALFARLEGWPTTVVDHLEELDREIAEILGSR